jgi:hypothetical protein
MTCFRPGFCCVSVALTGPSPIWGIVFLDRECCPSPLWEGELSENAMEGLWGVATVEGLRVPLPSP